MSTPPTVPDLESPPAHPHRIQLQRKRGWRKPVGAVVVSRPGRWGNPYKVGVNGDQAACVAHFQAEVLAGKLPVTVNDVHRDLAGRDLACWCRLKDPCHADVLLEVANRPQPSQAVAMDNDELRRRYEAGEPLNALAEAAGMTTGGLQARLRRIGVPPRRRQADSGHELTKDQVLDALAGNRSVAAAARALSVGRGAFTAKAQQYGLLTAPDLPADLADRYQGGASTRTLAQHYQVGPTTITRWLDVGGIPRRPQGRQPRDG